MEIQTSWTPDDVQKNPQNPYELFLFSLASSTGLEMLKHFKQQNTTFKNLSISVKGKLVPRYKTQVFDTIDLMITSESVSEAYHILNAVEYSQYLASGISAMISKSIPVRWILKVNEKMVGEGIANFEEENESPY